MLILLVLTLSFLLILNIKLSNGDILAPAPISVSMFLLMSVIALIFENYSDAHISATTYLIIVVALLLFSVGSYIGSIFNVRIGNKKNERQDFTRINIKLSITFCVIIFCLFIFVMTYRSTLRISNSISGNALVLAKVRSAYMYDDASTGGILSVMGRIVSAFGYLYSFILINNYILDGKKVCRKYIIDYVSYILVLILSFMNAILGTGRTFLIKWIVIFVVASYYMNNANLGKKVFGVKSNTKLVFKLIIVLACFFAIFLALGTLTGKTGLKSIAVSLYEYSGAAIPALNNFIENSFTRASHFGEESLYGMFVMLNHFGFNLPVDAANMEMINFANGITTNIYTSLRVYLHDFGYLGTFCVQFALGLVNGMLYCKLRKDKKYDICFIFLYGTLFYGVVMQAIAETWMRSFMSIAQISDIIIFIFLYKLLIKRGLIWGKRE